MTSDVGDGVPTFAVLHKPTTPNWGYHIHNGTAIPISTVDTGMGGWMQSRMSGQTAGSAPIKKDTSGDGSPDVHNCASMHVDVVPRVRQIIPDYVNS